MDAFARDVGAGLSGPEEPSPASAERDLEQIILDGIRLLPGAAALQIGCGAGRLLVPLARRAAEVRGVDISPVAIRRAHAVTAATPNVKTDVTDGSLAAFPDASLDFVFSFTVFQHVSAAEPIRAYVAEAARILKPGGVFRFQVDGRWWWDAAGRGPGAFEGVKLSPEQAHRLLEGMALSIVDERGAEGHYYWITVRKTGSGAAIDVEPRSWDLRELGSVLARLGAPKPAADARRIRAGTLTLRPALFSFVARRSALGDRDFVDLAFRALLGREGAEDLTGRHVEDLQRGFEDRLALLDAISASREFLDLVRPFDPERREAAHDAPTSALARLRRGLRRALGR